MALVSATVRNASIISTLVVLPFFLLQLMNLAPGSAFPVVLFLLLWLLPFFVLMLMLPAWYWLRKKSRAPHFWIRLIAAALLYAFWLGVLLDQMPCFLGIPNCD